MGMFQFGNDMKQSVKMSGTRVFWRMKTGRLRRTNYKDEIYCDLTATSLE